MLYRQIIKTGLLALMACQLAACGSGNNSEGGVKGTGTPPIPDPDGIQLAGSANKGPFVKDSTVLIQPLSDRAELSDSAVATVTTDSLGGFSYQAEQAGPVQISIDGFYLNEISASTSDNKLRLNAIYEVTENASQTTYLNVMTHLINDRVLYLVKEQQMSFSAAIDTAEDELLLALQDVLPQIDITSFTNLSVYQVDGTELDANGYLLALSSVLQQYAISASALSGQEDEIELQSILDFIADDLKEDGEIDSPGIIQAMQAAFLEIDVALIEKSLTDRSAVVLGVALEVPEISQLFGQLLLTSPADNATVKDTTTVRASVPSHLTNLSLTLLVDGVAVAETSETPYQFEWHSYYWSDGDRHTLLIQFQDSSAREVPSNLVNVSITQDAAEFLTLTAPEHGSVFNNADSVALHWGEAGGAVSYELQVSDDEVFSTPFLDEGLIGRSFQLTGLNLGDYYWRIRAINSMGLKGVWSGFKRFSVVAPPIPVIAQDSNPAIWQETSKITLNWPTIDVGKSFSLQLSQDADFGNIIIETETSTNSAELTIASAGDYYWRVATLNSVGYSGDWSEVQQFSFIGPEAPVDLEHSVTKVDAEYSVDFSWAEEENSWSYIVEIAKDKDFTSIEQQIETNNNQVQLQLGAGEYFWRVTGKHGSVLGVSSIGESVEAGAWSKRFGGSGWDDSSQLIALQDGGYLILATTSSFEITKTTGKASWIIKVDEQGNLVWQKIFPTMLIIHNFFETSDGSIIAVGSMYEEAFALKMDSLGNDVWEKRYIPEATSYYAFLKMVEWNDKLYVLAASSYTDNPLSQFRSRNFLHEISMSDGLVADQIPFPFDDFFITQVHNIKVTSSGCLAVAGISQSDSFSYNGSYLFCLNQSFDLEFLVQPIDRQFFRHKGDFFELASGKFALINLTIASVYSDGSDFVDNSYDDISFPNVKVVADNNGGFIGLFRDNTDPNDSSFSAPLRLVGFDGSLNRQKQTAILNFAEYTFLATIGGTGIVNNEDGSVTLLVTEDENTPNSPESNWDFVLKKIIPDWQY